MKKSVIREILDGLPYLMRKKAEEQVAKAFRERPQLTEQEFKDMWNKVIREQKTQVDNRLPDTRPNSDDVVA